MGERSTLYSCMAMKRRKRRKKMNEAIFSNGRYVFIMCVWVWLTSTKKRGDGIMKRLVRDATLHACKLTGIWSYCCREHDYHASQPYMEFACVSYVMRKYFELLQTQWATPHLTHIWIEVICDCDTQHKHIPFNMSRTPHSYKGCHLMEWERIFQQI